MSTRASPAASAPVIRAAYLRDGFALVPGALPRAVVGAAVPAIADVIAGRYETGVAPRRSHLDGSDPTALVKIDMAHLSDRRIRAIATHPLIGELAAAATGARRVQLWASQLLVKPSGGAHASHVGWHQDYHYWQYWEPDSELLTAWVAISDVGPDCGPIRFLAGSCHWGYRGIGDFFLDQGLDAVPSVGGEPAREVAVILPVGGVSLHHRLTVHGSSDNTSGRPRLSMALHLRTERSAPRPGASDYFVSHLDEPDHSPVLFER